MKRTFPYPVTLGLMALMVGLLAPVLSRAQTASKGYTSAVKVHGSIFLSYSWRNAKEAEAIDSLFHSRGIVLLRDTREMGLKSKTEEYMARTKTADFVLLLLSEAFLKSPNTMFEIMTMWESPDIKRRFLPVLVGESPESLVGKQKDIEAFWDGISKDYQKDLKLDVVTQHDRDRVKRCADIRKMVPEIMEYMRKNPVFEYQKLVSARFQPVFEKITARETELRKAIEFVGTHYENDPDPGFDSLLQVFPGNMHVLVAKMTQTSDPSLRTQRFEELVTRYPHFGQPWFDQGISMAFMGEVEEGLKTIRRGIRLDRKNGYETCALVHQYSTYQMDSASHYYRLALEEAPGDVNLLTEYAGFFNQEFPQNPFALRKFLLLYAQTIETEPEIWIPYFEDETHGDFQKYDDGLDELIKETSPNDLKNSLKVLQYILYVFHDQPDHPELKEALMREAPHLPWKEYETALGE
ncbi:MAG: toll/interleukin-1 receptor domain-containing protein [Bacteroidia bacterium]|nr:toll/interleukin-1 receptor domain-containing protein [Bacteroidia bacterium]